MVWGVMTASGRVAGEEGAEAEQVKGRGGTCPISPLSPQRTPLRPRLWPSEGGKFGHAAEPYRGQRRAPDSPRPLEGPEESTRLPEAP